MNEVVEIGGYGAHEKLHIQGDDVRKITEIRYSSQFFSIKEVVE